MQTISVCFFLIGKEEFFEQPSCNDSCDSPTCMFQTLLAKLSSVCVTIYPSLFGMGVGDLKDTISRSQ